jgi:hypothetical protein
VLLRALKSSREFEIGRVFFERFYIPTQHLEKVYKKINGTLSVFLNTKEVG